MSEKRPEPAEKLSEGKIAAAGTFSERLENFWYHYKWTVLVVAFFLIVFVVCLVQCAGREIADTYVGYSGGCELSEEDRMAINSVFSSLLPEGTDGKAPQIGLNVYTYFSEEELKTLYTDPDTGALNEAYFTAKQANAERLNSLGDYLMTGDCAVWLVSEAVYQTSNMKQLVRPLSDVFGDKTPTGAYNGNAIRLSETALYNTYSALQALPEDTLIILTSKLITSNAERYEASVELFRAIVNFEAP